MFVSKVALAVLRELRLEDLAQPQRGLGLRPGKFGDCCDRRDIQRHFVLALADESLEGRHGMTEELDGEQVDGVRAASGIEHVAREHGVELQPLELDTRAAKHCRLELRVMRGLGDRRIGQERPERSQGRIAKGRKVHRIRHAGGNEPGGDAACLGGLRLRRRSSG